MSSGVLKGLTLIDEAKSRTLSIESFCHFVMQDESDDIRQPHSDWSGVIALLEVLNAVPLHYFGSQEKDALFYTGIIIEKLVVQECLHTPKQANTSILEIVAVCRKLSLKYISSRDDPSGIVSNVKSRHPCPFVLILSI
jgi:hypothetical protein